MPKSTLGKLLLDRANAIVCRRFTRIPASFPVIIGGKDLVGNPFEEGTHTIDVGKQGLRTSTSFRLRINDEVVIAQSAAHKNLPARVVWQAPSDSPQKPTETGIEFLEPLEPSRIWTIESVPDDWLKPPTDPTTNQKLDCYWAREKSLPVLPEDIVDAPPLIPSSVSSHTAMVDSEMGSTESFTHMNPFIEGNQGHQEAESAGTSLGPVAGELPGEARNAGGAPAKEYETPASRSPSMPPRPSKPSPEPTVPSKKGVPLEDLNRLARTLNEQADVISTGVDTAMNSLRSAAEDAVARLHLVCDQSENHLKQVAEDCAMRFADLKASVVEENRQSVENALTGMRDQLSQMQAQVSRLSNESGQPMAVGVLANENNGGEQVGAALADFRRQVEEILNEFRIKASDEIQDQLRRATNSLKGVSVMEQKELQSKSAALQSEYERHSVSYPEFPKGDRETLRPRRWGIVWSSVVLVLALGALGGIAYESTRPTMRLVTDPPPEFIDTTASPNLKPVEEQLSRAYWNRAVEVIQKTYHSGTVLPEHPPADFTLEPRDTVGIGTKSIEESSRGRYWQKLRQVWDHPQIWVQTYEWNTDWLFAPLKQLGILLRG